MYAGCVTVIEGIIRKYCIHKTFIKLFKPSLRQETFGTVWADHLSLIATCVENSINNSSCLCLYELFSFVSNGFGGKENGLVAQTFNEKRKVSTLTHEKANLENRNCHQIGFL